MAARFWVGQSGGGNYNSTDWALTTGGTTGQVAPTSSDDVHFDGAGTFGNTSCTITAAANALSVVFTSGYTAIITINATFTLTIAGNFTDNTAHTWTVNSTDVGALTINTTSTITSGGKTFPGNVTLSGATTKTLSGNWTITGGLVLLTAAQVINKTAAETLSCAGLTTSGTCSGTVTIIITGGTWSGNNALTVSALQFNGSSTISGTVNYSGAITYTSGTITTTSSTFTVGAATTFNTNGITFSTVSFTANATYTINSLLSASTITLQTTMTFAGTSGWSTGTLSSAGITAAQTITLQNSVIYTITSAFNCFTSRTGSILVFTSNDGTLKATLTLNNGATCNVLASFTRIDASNGRAIYTFNGTVTTCNNIFSFNDALPPAIGRVIHAGATY